LLGVLGGDGRIARAVKMLRHDLLALPRIKISQIFLGDLAGAVLIHILVHDADRRLRHDADRRRNDVEFRRSQFFYCQKRLIFPR